MSLALVTRSLENKMIDDAEDRPEREPEANIVDDDAQEQPKAQPEGDCGCESLVFGRAGLSVLCGHANLINTATVPGLNALISQAVWPLPSNVSDGSGSA